MFDGNGGPDIEEVSVVKAGQGAGESCGGGLSWGWIWSGGAELVGSSGGGSVSRRRRVEC